MNFFDSVVQFFETVIDLISQLFSSLYTALAFIQSSVVFTTTLSVYLPSVIGGCFVIVIALGVVKFIVGR